MKQSWLCTYSGLKPALFFHILVRNDKCTAKRSVKKSGRQKKLVWNKKHHFLDQMTWFWIKTVAITLPQSCRRIKLVRRGVWLNTVCASMNMKCMIKHGMQIMLSKLTELSFSQVLLSAFNPQSTLFVAWSTSMSVANQYLEAHTHRHKSLV